MTLNDLITKIEEKDQENESKKIYTKGILALVYDNYRIMGDTTEIKRAVANYKKNTGVDLLTKEIAYQYDGCAYLTIPDTNVAYIDRDAVESTDDGEDSVDEDGGDEELPPDTPPDP